MKRNKSSVVVYQYCCTLSEYALIYALCFYPVSFFIESDLKYMCTDYSSMSITIRDTYSNVRKYCLHFQVEYLASKDFLTHINFLMDFSYQKLIFITKEHHSS